MYLLVQPLREAEQLRQVFAEDGWRVNQAQCDVLRVEHPNVTDQRGARERLQTLGLLTSSSCHIDFPLVG